MSNPAENILATLKELINSERWYYAPPPKLVVPRWAVDKFGSDAITEWCQAHGMEWEICP